MLVPGGSGHGELTGALSGSVVFAAVLHAASPVVVVRGDLAREPGPGAAVVVGADGSDSCQEAIRFAALTAAGCGAPLVVVHAWRSARAGAFATEYWQRAHPGLDPDGAGEARARNLLQEVAADLRRQHPGLTVRTVPVEGQPRAALAEAADGTGLLTVGARGLGGFAGLMLGSVSRD
jgi:nucleotide-binding universal stress UspA family protein